ncbi:hypothetical protein IQ10_03565 [Halalkalibacter nanhaiisediminis]|uniref:Uncharacterized protein n=2 Tax=Halalkalibacter nanhaiisediminis TaxID=688079 RepID=A0A562Q877_9BACI|nr:hypothetical protein IQ10_03565 [Halalkalibacter nanhaiisediminis]
MEPVDYYVKMFNGKHVAEESIRVKATDRCNSRLRDLANGTTETVPLFANTKTVVDGVMTYHGTYTIPAEVTAMTSVQAHLLGATPADKSNLSGGNQQKVHCG